VEVLDGALREAFPDGSIAPPIQALLKELTLLNPAWEAHPIFATYTQELDAPVTEASPLIFLRWSRLPDKDLHRAWGEIFNANTRGHRALKPPQEIGLAPLYTTPDPALPGQGRAFSAPFSVSLPEIHAGFYANLDSDALPYQRPPAAETAALAEERLSSLGIIAGQEMRHTASLSPIALLRPWNIRLRVRCGRHEHTLEGQAKTWGRGLSLADARASCLMEMVERASVYLSISNEAIEGRACHTPVRLARLSELLAESRAGLCGDGSRALDPNDFPLEVPYTDAPLYWMQGERSCGCWGEPIHVPVQMAGLFCNLDEIALFDAPGSTGIATGCSLEEAKLAAVLEVLERDAEATTPFSKAACFSLEADAADDPFLSALLADYKARGINVQFQDLTGPLGVPVYKCFVMSARGTIAAGYGAGLSTRRAIISALTETPFPYPDSGPSGPPLRRLPVKMLHELPDYSLPSPAKSLAMLEELLRQNGRAPMYVNLTRTDLVFPVVRCFIPGLELTADRDSFSRVPYRLFANYLRDFS
jgi:YcaO-like protein with predicted kinase domain